MQRRWVPSIRAKWRVSTVLTVFYAAGMADAASAGEPRAVVLDAETGVILHARLANVAHPPASLAKLMTLYLVFDGLDRRRIALGTKWTVSRRAATQRPSKIHLSIGERISVRNLVSAIVVKSANDAAVTIAEGIAGSERRFAGLMNETARRLGMRRTRFLNATGLDRRGQVTTARDMAVLARALLHHFPHRYAQFARTHMHYRGRTYRTSNKLLRRHWPVDGMKIGFTTRAGYSFVASARLNRRRVIAVLLGERSARARFARAEKLITAGFRLSRGRLDRHAQRFGRLKTVARFDSLRNWHGRTVRMAERPTRTRKIPSASGAGDGSAILPVAATW